MTIEEFLADYGSTTTHFKSWSDVYHLEVLSHQILDDGFQRVVVIFVDKIPVMLGLSEVEVKHSIFLDILQNAGEVPIGVRLFAPNSGIQRVQTKVGKIDTNIITNKAVRSYLIKTNISGLLYFRQSTFVLNEQNMTLKEYVLPGLIDLLATKIPN